MMVRSDRDQFMSYYNRNRAPGSSRECQHQTVRDFYGEAVIQYLGGRLYVVQREEYCGA